MSASLDRRRTFAIVSHPDAGKTTLTEKLLLYGGALDLAGSVTARRNARTTTSDWMELERRRGISVSSTVLQFDYDRYVVNLLDTPGHADFSEDTYRVLTAVDSALMLIDAGKGIESQTRKLFEVCRARDLPLVVFVNKLDRPSREPLALLDEIESVLGLEPCPVTWPLGSGPEFRGVYDRRTSEVHFFERTPGGAYRAPVEVHDVSAPAVRAALAPDVHDAVVEEIALLDAACAPLDPRAVRAGTQTPVFFGSAINNFGVQILLDAFLDLAPAPGPRRAGSRTVDPREPAFSGFVFKIQANMDPRHRDRLAFVRVCSGRFRRDMTVVHTRTGDPMRLTSSHRVFGRDRETVEEALPGDVVGVVGRRELRIGDTLAEEPALAFDPIPAFPPECFAWIHVARPAHVKRFRRGLAQLLEEGVVQSFQEGSARQRVPLLGAVGPLQFEVVRHRLLAEYGAEARIEAAPWTLLRWVARGTVDPDRLPHGATIVTGSDGGTAILFTRSLSLELFRENAPDVRLSAYRPEDAARRAS